jgi:hypothetical protein
VLSWFLDPRPCPQPGYNWNNCYQAATHVPPPPTFGHVAEAEAVDDWEQRTETLHGLSKKRDESPAERGGVSKRRAGTPLEVAGKSSFTLKPFVPRVIVRLPGECECGNREDQWSKASRSVARQCCRTRNFLPITQLRQTNHVMVLQLFCPKQSSAHPRLLVPGFMPDLACRLNQLLRSPEQQSVSRCAAPPIVPSLPRSTTLV